MLESLRLRAEQWFVDIIPSPEESVKMHVGVLEHEQHNARVWVKLEELKLTKRIEVRTPQDHHRVSTSDQDYAMGLFRNQYEGLLLYKQGKVDLKPYKIQYDPHANRWNTGPGINTNLS